MTKHKSPSSAKAATSNAKPLSRRDFLKMIPPMFLAGLMNRFDVASMHTSPASSAIHLSGRDFDGWSVELGDALYSRPGEAPVSITDIETIHPGKYSELRANIQRRVIMAHNITYKRIVDENAIRFLHQCFYQFRLPYLPRPVETDDWNAQTLEGGFFVWDGANTRLDYGIAFQWDLNPWSNFGDVMVWNASGGEGQWLPAGRLAPDTKWHTLKMTVDMVSEIATLAIDDVEYPVTLSRTSKPDSWGTEIAARLQAEIVSIYPEPSGLMAAHKAQFRNWKWHSRFIYPQ